jgi:integrase/recombinase XerD
MYHLKREVVGGVENVSLGLPEADAYLKFVRDRCRLNTVLSYGYDLQVFLNSIQKSVLEMTPLDILTFIENQQSAYNRQGRTNGLSAKRPGLSNRTIKRRLAAVAGFYEYLSVYHNLSLKISPVPRTLVRRKTSWGNWYGRPAAPLIRAPETQPRPLDPEDLEPFIESMRCHRDRAMVLLMLLAGLRKSEVLKLSLDDIDFGQHTLTVKEGKGGHQRVVAISGTGLQELISYLNTERPPSRSERVFLVMKGRNRGLPMTVGALDTIIEYHRKKANTPGVQCHRLRHTCFTRLRQAGMSLEALQAQAGHRNITTTRMYLHLCPRELQKEYLRVSDTLFSGGIVDD